MLAGEVTVDGAPADKPGMPVAASAALAVAARPRFVSRGGDKLDHALAAFGVDVRGEDALDLGSSTGGFVDRLLQGGAAGVVAVDVGYGQLDWRLRQDERVTVPGTHQQPRPVARQRCRSGPRLSPPTSRSSPSRWRWSRC